MIILSYFMLDHLLFLNNVIIEIIIIVVVNFIVNRGHCEWGVGDLTTSDQGDFLNLGG